MKARSPRIPLLTHDPKSAIIASLVNALRHGGFDAYRGTGENSDDKGIVV